MMETSLLAGAAAVATSLVMLGRMLFGPRRTTATLDLGTVSRASLDARAVTLEHGAGARALQPLLDSIGRLARKLTPAGRIAALEHRLLLAGTPRGWTTERLLAVKALFGVAGAALGLAQLTSAPSPRTFVLGAALTLGGFFGPDLILNHKADARQQLIKRALPDTVDQLVIAVRAGLGLDAAIARVAGTTEGPLASELARAVQDSRAGVPRADALAALSERARVPELRQVVIALAQAEKLGVPVAHTLQIQAAELRLKRRQYAEERAMKIPVKILFPMVLCIMPCLFIVVLGPAAINIANTL